MQKLDKKTFLPALMIATIGLAIAVLLTRLTPFQVLELKFTDQLFDWRGELDVSNSPIVLVAISDESDNEIPFKWPWPSEIHARLVENLNRAGAKAILFDVIFESEDERENPKGDSLFAEALEKHGNVVLAGDFQQTGSGASQMNAPIFPKEILLRNNPNPVGLVRVPSDPDGYVRSYFIGRNHQNRSYLMLGLEGLKEFHDIERDQVDPLDASKGTKPFNIGPYEIERENINSFLINYAGPEGLFPIIDYHKVIDDSSFQTKSEREAFPVNDFDDPDFGLLQQGIFEGKIVIVGSTMPVLQDFYPTPFASADQQRPGFEVHAHAMNTIMTGNYLHRANDWLTIVVIIVFSFLIALISRKSSTFIGILITLILAGLYILLAYMLFMQANLIIAVTGPLFALALTQIGLIGYDYYIEQREKKRIKGMFSSYVSPKLVNKMVASGEEPQLGGEETYMSAFFSDIESFSTFSEQLDATQLVTLINEYLDAMTQILNNHGGTLDKYIGDAIVGFFGAPLPMDDHALQACIVSQKMQKKLDELREKWKEEDWPDIVQNMKNRIGINTGVMVTGNMGSVRRFNYTMMGDNVNLAARCESGAKQYGVYTMVTGATKEEAEQFGNDCVFRLLDNIVVKGRTKPVKVYEVADLRSDADDRLFECIETYEEGMRHYFDQEWEKAISCFKHSLSLERHTDNNPSKIFLNRCNLMKADPPGIDWDGVFIMKTK